VSASDAHESVLIVILTVALRNHIIFRDGYPLLRVRSILTMTLLIGLVLVPLLDQALKLFVRTQIGHRSLSLGVLGSVRMVHSRIWSMRAFGGMSLGVMWVIWIAAAGASVVISAAVPSVGLSFGLLLGGALSHAIETSIRGTVCDYVCLRFWPAFNLADVALTAGALGLALKVASSLS
jgi:signal peptidase II